MQEKNCFFSLNNPAKPELHPDRHRRSSAKAVESGRRQVAWERLQQPTARTAQTPKHRSAPGQSRHAGKLSNNFPLPLPVVSSQKRKNRSTETGKHFTSCPYGEVDIIWFITCWQKNRATGATNDVWNDHSQGRPVFFV